MGRKHESIILDDAIVSLIEDSIKPGTLGKIDAIATEFKKIDKDGRTTKQWKDLTNRLLNKSSQRRNGASKEVRHVIALHFECTDWTSFIKTHLPDLTNMIDSGEEQTTKKKVTKKTESKKEKPTLPKEEIAKFDFGSFDFFYLYYYLGAEGSAKPAVLCFTKEPDEKELSDGLIYYLTDCDTNGEKLGYFTHSCTFSLKKVLPPNHEKGRPPEFLYFKGICEDAAKPKEQVSIKDPLYLEKVSKYGNQVNFFTFHCGRNVIGERYLFFANTSVINRKETKTVDTPSIQIAVIRRIERTSILEEIQADIHPWIKNVLLGKRFDFSDTLENKVFKTKDSFEKEINNIKLDVNDRPKAVNDQYFCSDQIKGIYFGFYLRQSFGQDPGGGMAFMLIEVFADSKVKCTAYDQTQTEYVSYDGTFKFPVNQNKTTIMGDFLKEHAEAKMFMFLKSKGNLMYMGTISGFANTHTPYSSPIVLYYIKTKRVFTKLRDFYLPQRVPKEKIIQLFQSIKNKIPRFGNGDPYSMVRKDLKKAEAEFFGTVKNCFLVK